MSRRCSENVHLGEDDRTMYVQFTSCVHGELHEPIKLVMIKTKNSKDIRDI